MIVKRVTIGRAVASPTSRQQRDITKYLEG
jgi:hypothetical protein